MTQGRVLVIAGSDSGGGAGIQADIKTITALGGYAATAVTALTVQNTLGVQAIEPVSTDFVSRQIEVVLDDLGADAIKIGMLGSADIVRSVADALAGFDGPIILDPVMVAKGGASLLEDDATSSMIERLIPMTHLLTPNIPESEVLTGLSIGSAPTMAPAARALRDMGAENILLKGGHLEGEMLTDLLLTPEGPTAFQARRIESQHTHGTGCTLASACAAGLALGQDLPTAIAHARAYVREAIRTAPGFGAGHGPLNHGHPLQGG